MRYEVIPGKVWKNKMNGRTASIYGSVPYISKQEAAEWEIVQVGWTIRDNRRNVVNAGFNIDRMDREAVQARADQWNAREPVREQWMKG